MFGDEHSLVRHARACELEIAAAQCVLCQQRQEEPYPQHQAGEHDENAPGGG